MQRPLSALETFIWAGGKLPRNFALAAKISGGISAGALRKALTQVSANRPEMRGRVVMLEGKPWYTNENVPEISLMEYTGDWQQIIASDLICPFLTDQGPLVRMLLVHQAAFDFVIIVCHHCIADGISAAYALRDILYCLMGNAPLTTTDEPMPCLDQLLPTPAEMRIETPMIPSTNSVSEPYPIQLTDPIYILSGSLSTGQTANLMAACHREKTSVHAACCTAFLTTGGILSDAGLAVMNKVSSPTSLRNRLTRPVGDHFGLYIHPGIRTALPDLAEGTGFWEKARAMKSALTQEINGTEFWGMFFMALQALSLLPLELALQMSEMPVDYDLSLTNIGQMDFPQGNNQLHIEAVYGPMVNSMAGEKIVGLFTASGNLTLCFVSRTEVIPRDTARRWCMTALRELGQAAGWVDFVEIS